MDYINCNEIGEYVFIGELSLDGKLNKINGVLPMCIEAFNLGIKKVIVPFENRMEAGVVEGLEVFPAKTLNDVIAHLNGSILIETYKTDIQKIFSSKKKYEFDFSEVKGQEKVKRALEIAGAGGHNCLLIGSPRIWKNYASKKIAINFTGYYF